MNNTNNGLLTDIWGPHAWKTLHSFTFGYPMEPTDEQKEKYKKFFELVGDVLPCKYCRKSYKEFINDGNSKLTMECMKNRGTLTKWLYNLHNRVNDKLNSNYGLTYENMCNEYESYRAKCNVKNDIDIGGCVTALNDKKIAYKNNNNKSCKLLDRKIVQPFINLAKNIIDDKYMVFAFMDEHELNNLIDSNDNIWIERNKLCNKIIDHIHETGENTINKNGFPSENELKLIMMHTSTIPKDVLIKISQKLLTKENIINQNINYTLKKI